MADDPSQTPPPSPPTPQPKAPTGQQIGVSPIAPAILAQILAGMRPGLSPYMGPAGHGQGIQLLLPGIVQQAQQTLWHGPYPPPEAIERYEKILPGTFHRMITMAEQLQNAQIEESKRVMDYTQNDTKRGHWLGAAVTVLAMGGALLSLKLGYPWVAGAFLSVPVMAVAKALIDSAKSQTPTQIIQAAAGETTPSAQTTATTGSGEIA
jgi:uncharacterized membrane protein